LIPIVAAALLGGCVSATGPLYRDVSASLTPRSGDGMVIVYWSQSLRTGDNQYWLFMNDEVVRDHPLHKDGFYSYDAVPGPLDVSFSLQPAKMSAVGWASSVLPLGGGLINYYIQHRRPYVDVNIVPGQITYVRLAKDFWRGPIPEEVPQSQGESEIQGCHWIDPQ
jgi:hypothetical protein